MEYSRPEGALSADPTLWLYTSLSSGSSTIVTATARIEGILKANRVPFKALDLATEEKARMLWGRRAGKRKLPGLVRAGMVLADLAELEEWNEYGEVRENLLDEEESSSTTATTPATPSTPSNAPPRPTGPTPLSAATHNASTSSVVPPAPPAPTPGTGATSSAVVTPTTLKASGADAASRASTESGRPLAESERQAAMLTLAEQVAARAKKSSGLRTSSGSVISKKGTDAASTTGAKTAPSASEAAKEKEEEKEQEADVDDAGVSEAVPKEPVAELDRAPTGHILEPAEPDTIEKVESETAIKEEPEKEGPPAIEKPKHNEEKAENEKAERVVPVTKKELSEDESEEETEDDSSVEESSGKAKDEAEEQKGDQIPAPSAKSEEPSTQTASKKETLTEKVQATDETEEELRKKDEATGERTQDQGLLLASDGQRRAGGRAERGKRGALRGAIDIDAANREEEGDDIYIPGFNSPLMPGKRATLSDFNFDFEGGFGGAPSTGAAILQEQEHRSNNPEQATTLHSYANNDNIKGLRNQKSMVDSEGGVGGMEEDKGISPTEDDTQLQKSPSCWTLLFSCGSGGRQKKSS